MYRKLLLSLLLTLLCLPAAAESRVLLHTTLGDITVRLFDETPQHRDNFLRLSAEGYYDGLLFHRVIRGFMIQSGDPDSRTAQPGQLLGDGGPDYTLPLELALPERFHYRGALAAAREGDDVNPERRSSGSQFYIVWGKAFTASSLQPIREQVSQATGGECEITYEMSNVYQRLGGAPHLDGQYTVFGEVVAGLSVVKAIQAVKTDKNDRPLQDVRILSATVL